MPIELLRVLLENGPNIAIVVLCVFMYYLGRDLKELKTHHIECHKHVSEFLHNFGQRIGTLEGRFKNKKKK